MPDLLIDYAWQHPTPDAIVQSGYKGVLRYLSHDPSKDITAEEKAALESLGLKIGLVWETLANPLSTDPIRARLDANTKADALHFPATMAIYYAFDYDVPPSDYDAAEAWLHAATHAFRATGVYGPRLFIEEMLRRGAAQYAWQAGGSYLWENGQNGIVSNVAHLYQRASATLPPPAPLGSYGEDVALQGYWGQALYGSGGGTQLPSPPPIPGKVLMALPPSAIPIQRFKMGWSPDGKEFDWGLLGADGHVYHVWWLTGPSTWNGPEVIDQL